MTCKRITRGGKTVGFACSRGNRQPRTSCCVEGCEAVGAYLCDYPIESSTGLQTCDAAMCRRHAKLVKHATHYCPEHARQTGGKPV